MDVLTELMNTSNLSGYNERWVKLVRIKNRMATAVELVEFCTDFILWQEEREFDASLNEIYSEILDLTSLEPYTDEYTEIAYILVDKLYVMHT